MSSRRISKPKEQKMHLIEDAFEHPESRFFVLTNDFLAIITVLSVMAIVLETVAILDSYTPLFKTIEYAATIIFTIEYGLRFYISPKKFNYAFSFFGILDLIAILPTYLGLGNLTFLKASRSLRILRLLRMVRLARFARIKRKKNAASSLYVLNIQIYATALIVTVLVLGTLFYIFEAESKNAQDIPSGMYWAFKVILGGLPTPQPETIGGTLTLIGSRFASMILLGLMIGLCGTILRKMLIGSEKDS